MRGEFKRSLQHQSTGITQRLLVESFCWGLPREGFSRQITECMGDCFKNVSVPLGESSSPPESCDVAIGFCFFVHVVMGGEGQREQGNGRIYREVCVNGEFFITLLCRIFS